MCGIEKVKVETWDRCPCQNLRARINWPGRMDIFSLKILMICHRAEDCLKVNNLVAFLIKQNCSRFELAII